MEQPEEKKFSEKAKEFTEKAKDALPTTDTWKEVGKYVADKLMVGITVIAGVATYAWLSTRSK